MKSPTKMKSFPENFKKLTGPAAASLFATKRRVEDGAGRTESSSSPILEGSEGSPNGLPKQKKRRSIGIKKAALSTSFKKNASLEKSMRGQTLAVNNRSLANQVQGLKTQLRIAQEENVDKSRQVNELTARVRRLEVIDDQERFELLVQERLKQELALLADLVRETVVGLSRSAEKLNSVLTISQRMQTANVDQRRTILAPRPRTLISSPQDRASRLPALFDQHETSSSLCAPTMRKKSTASVEHRKINSLQEEMRIDENEEENEGEMGDKAEVLRKSQPSPAAAAAANSTAQLSIIDEVTEESPFAKKDKVPRTPLSKMAAQSNVWESEAPPRRKTVSPPRPLRPMSPALVQKMYKQPSDNDEVEVGTAASANDSDQVVAETPPSSRRSRNRDETLTESAANRSDPALPPAQDPDEFDESSFISVRSKVRSRRRDIVSDDDDDEESSDNKRPLPTVEPLNEAKKPSPPKKLRTDRRDTFIVSKPAVFVRPSLIESRELPPLPSPHRSHLPLRLSSPRIGGGRQSARSSSTDQDDTLKAKLSTTPHAAPLNSSNPSNSGKSGASPSTAAPKISVNVASERESPRFFKRPNAAEEQINSAAFLQPPTIGVFDLSPISTDDSPEQPGAAVVRKKASTKPKKKRSRAARSKTPMIDSPATKTTMDKPLSEKKSNAEQLAVRHGERSATATGGESSVNATYIVPIGRSSRSRSNVRPRTPVPTEDDHANPADRTDTSESAEGEPARGRSRRNAALKVTSFKEQSLNTKMRRDK